MKQFIAYYRVSTQKQGQSGLGLDAQRKAVEGFARGGELIAEYQDVESGSKSNRQGLAEAIKHARQTGAVLLIAKLDRLARNLEFIARLMNAGVKFVACDMPDANELTIHIFAALAEHERKLISQRTKAALAVLKDRGAQLGKPENLDESARLKGLRTRKENARSNEHWQRAGALVVSMREQGKSLPVIAKALNDAGFVTRRGKKFSPTQVLRLFDRYNGKTAA